MADVIAELFGRLGWQVEDDGIKEFEKDAKKAGVATEGFATKLNMAMEVAAKVAQGIATLVNSVVDLTTEFADNGTELDSWAKKIGVTTTELQRLEKAGAATGAEADNVREAVKTLRENIGEMGRVATGPAVDSLGSLGLKLEDIQGLGAEDQMRLLATAMGEVEDQSKRISIALELMGEDGGALLPLFAEGADAISRYGDEAERAGHIMSEQQVEKAKEAAAAFRVFDAEIQEAKNSIAAALAPAIPKVTEKITKWLDENDKLIEQDIPKLIEGITEVIIPLVGQFVEGVAGAKDFAGEVEGLTEEFIPLEIAVKAVTTPIRVQMKVWETMGDIFSTVVGWIAKAVDYFGEFAGVIGVANEQIMKFKLLTGQEVGPTVTTREAPDFVGGDANPNNRRKRERAEFAKEVANLSPREIRERLASGELTSDQQQILERRLPQAEAEALGVAAQVQGQAGQLQNRLQGIADVERRRRIREEFERNAKASVAGSGGGGGGRGGGRGGGGGSSGPSVDEILDRTVYGASTSGGGGSSAVQGAKFLRVDASLHVTNEIQIDGADASDPERLAEMVSEKVTEGMAEEWRRLADNYELAVDS